MQTLAAGSCCALHQECRSPLCLYLPSTSPQPLFVFSVTNPFRPHLHKKPSYLIKKTRKPCALHDPSNCLLVRTSAFTSSRSSGVSASRRSRNVFSVEKLNRCSHFGKQYGDLSKSKNRTTIQPNQFPLLGIYLKKKKLNPNSKR